MDREFLSRLIQSDSALELNFLGVAALIALGMVYILGLSILRAKITPKSLLVSSLTLLVYYFVGSWYLPIPVRSLGFLAPFCILFIVIHKVAIIKALGTAALCITANALGDVLLVAIFSFFPSTKYFFTQDPFGFSLAVLIGSLIPLAAILALRFTKYKIVFPSSIKESWHYVLGYVGITYIFAWISTKYLSGKCDLEDFISIVLALILTVAALQITQNLLRKKYEIGLYCKEQEFLAVIDEAVETERRKPKLVKVETPGPVKEPIREIQDAIDCMRLKLTEKEFEIKKYL